MVKTVNVNGLCFVARQLGEDGWVAWRKGYVYRGMKMGYGPTADQAAAEAAAAWGIRAT